MIAYALIYTAYYCLVLLFAKSKLRFFSATAIVFLACISAFSGSVGTDTWVYNNYYDDIRANGCVNGEMEPLFCIYVNALTRASDTNSLIRVCNAALIAFLFGWPFRKSYRKQLLVLSLLFPSIYLDYSMNGVRSGIAYALIFFVFALVSKVHIGQRPSFVGYVAAFSIHISGVVVYAVYRMSQSRYRLRAFIIGTLGIAAALYAVGKFIQPELLLRFITSLDSEPFSIFSGYLPAMINLLVVALLRRYRLLTKSSVIYLALSNIIFLIAARYTYNGIRMLQIMYFVEMMLLITKIRRRLDHRGLIILTFIMIFTLSSKLRNWENEAQLGATPTPFIPYHFTWSEQ